jgi:hypothetical protein
MTPFVIAKVDALGVLTFDHCASNDHRRGSVT